MDIAGFRSLFTAEGQQALVAAAGFAPREEDFLAHFRSLSRRFAPGLARAALETAILRLEAGTKFPFAERMFFTREALEQASAWEVSTHRAQRFRPFPLLADLGCSIGGDTLALAALAPTLALDLDPLRLRMAQANLQALGLSERALTLQADLAVALPFRITSRSSPGIGLFFDPARRDRGKRAYSVHAYRPPLPVIRDWLERFPALGVKVSPGVRRPELAGYAAEVEFISLQGEMKEAVLWFGPLKTAARRATVLPGPHTLASAMDTSPPLPVSEPRAFLYEPDPAIIRAGLVTDLGSQLDAAQLDPSIAYLTADRKIQTPFARCWQVEAWLPFQLKRLRAALRQRGVGQLVIKKRGSPLQPEALLHDLRLEGDRECLLFLTQLRGRPIAILARP